MVLFQRKTELNKFLSEKIKENCSGKLVVIYEPRLEVDF